MLYQKGIQVFLPATASEWQRKMVEERYEPRSIRESILEGMFSIGARARFLSYSQKASAFGNRS
jgi:hypothetical protein